MKEVEYEISEAGRNPKVRKSRRAERSAEARNPKAAEGEIAKSEAAAGMWYCSDFWSWGDEPSAEPLVLRDGPAGSARAAEILMERTARFGETIIRFAKKIPRNPGNNRLIDQLVGAGTSVGANYCEADDAVSGKEFKQKIGTCRKESKETMFFLRMIAAAEEEPSLRGASALARSQRTQPHLRRNMEEMSL